MIGLVYSTRGLVPLHCPILSTLRTELTLGSACTACFQLVPQTRLAYPHALPFLCRHQLGLDVSPHLFGYLLGRLLDGIECSHHSLVLEFWCLMQTLFAISHAFCELLLGRMFFLQQLDAKSAVLSETLRCWLHTLFGIWLRIFASPQSLQNILACCILSAAVFGKTEPFPSSSIRSSSWIYRTPLDSQIWSN